MPRYSAWGFWPLFMIVVPILIGTGAVVGAIIAPSTQTFVGAALTALGSAYIAWRYGQARERLGREHVDYVASYRVNVFCMDVEARRRWNHHARVLLVSALNEVAEKMGSSHLKKFDIHIVSRPFMQRGLDGLNRGTWWYERDLVTLAWLPGEPAPLAMQHEFAHVVLSRREQLHGDDAHAEIRRLGW